MEDLNRIRQDIKNKRKALTSEFREAAAKKLFNNFLELKNVEKFKKIGVYSAVNGEIDLKYIIDWVWKNKKNCYLPVLDQNSSHKLLKFAEYTPDSVLVKNKFNILEPRDKNFIEVAELDLVLVPLTAFDKDLHRLGMGQGYYDATFYEHKKNNSKSLFLLGAGYSFQKIEKIIPNNTDIKLDGIITDEGV